LDAARELLAESGFGSLTVEGVATRAGVAKTTIYRRYRSRTDLALAVLIEGVSDVNSQPYVQDTTTELVLLVNRTIHLMSTTLWGRVMKGLVSEVAADPELAQVYREQVVSKRVADIRLLVERGIARGELRPGLDPEMVTDLLLGPIYYRLFLSGSPLDEDFGKRLVATLLPAFAT
jgi:AcrR family transcriptional regulator